MRSGVHAHADSLQVARVPFDDKITINFYMSGEGFNKLTSACPCPVWMMKVAADHNKAMFATDTPEETFDVADAPLGRIVNDDQSVIQSFSHSVVKSLHS